MIRKLFETYSLCLQCLKRIPAVYESENNKVYMKKHCEKHGTYRVLAWSDEKQYLAWAEQSVHAKKGNTKIKAEKNCPFDCGLCDQHEGTIYTAVLELTYQCNMNCKICFADAKEGLYKNE